MRLLAPMLLLVGCAHVAAPSDWESVSSCKVWGGVLVANESGLSCERIAEAFDRAAEVAELWRIASREDLEAAAQEVSFVVLDQPRLYVNQRGREVAGLMACDALPRVIMDRTLQGLLHELLHARDCVTGGRDNEFRAWRSFWALGAW